MAEKLKVKPESQASLPAAERLLPTAEKAEPLRKGEKDPAKALTEARTKIQETTRAESQLNPLEQLEASEKAAAPAKPLHVNRELKRITLKRELSDIRRKLNAPQRTLSKVIHQPAVSAISEPLGKTVSRPSGLLGGGLVAFLGTSGYLLLAKHSGMRYSYFIFLALFAAGFIVGLMLELLVYAATSSRRHAND
jgi:hypothetical protein